jgi:hypothetical protein
MISRIQNFDDLVQYLDENKLPYRSDRAQRLVEVPVRTPQLVGVVHVRWDPTQPFAQLIHPFLQNIPESRISEIEAAISRVNTATPLPGFGFEYDQRVVYMRLCVQTYSEGIPAIAFQRLVFAVLESSRQFAAAFADVASGAPGKDILALARRHAAASAI